MAFDPITYALCKGSGGSSLPPVTSSDNGKVLAVENGAWAASEQAKKFIVTLTPTSLDYSGTMDKTVAEIAAAYEAGMEIWFKVLLSATDYLEGALTAVRHFGSTSYDDYIGNIVIPSEGMLVTVETMGTNDGTKQTYSTHVYALTPAS